MKWILPISLIILLSFVSTFDKDNKAVNEKKIRKMVEHMTKIRNLFRNLDEDDTAKSEEDEDSDESSSNPGTQATSLTTVAMPKNENAPVKVLDIHSFNAPISSKSFTFTMVFFFPNRPPKIITFTVTLLLRFKLKNLEESETRSMDVVATCNVDPADENKQGENINYNCEAPKPENSEVVDAVTHNDFKFDGKSQSEGEVGFSEQAAEAAGSLQEQTATKPKSFNLKNGKYELDSGKIMITGDITSGDYPGKEGDKLYIDFKNKDKDNSNPHVNCSIIKIENNTNFTFLCKPKQDLDGTLYLAQMIDPTDNKTIILNMMDEYRNILYKVDSGNTTEPTTLTTVPAPKNKNGPVKLLDFHSFEAPYAAAKITFVIVFFFPNKPPKVITFTMTVLMRIKLRNLEESETISVEENANCKVDPADANKEGENINYNCEAPKPENSEVVDAVSHHDYKFDGKDASNEVSYSDQAAEEAGALANQTEKKSTTTFTLNNGQWEQIGNILFIIGEINSNGGIKKGDRWELVFLNEENRRRLSSGKEIQIDCSTTNIENNNYTFECNPGQDVKGNFAKAKMNSKSNLNNVIPLYLQMKDDYKNLNFKLNPDGNTKKINKSTYRKSSSGLSGGAIAGIVIACAVVLIIGSVIAIMMRKPSAPLDNNSTSVVGLRTVDNYSQ